MHSKQVYEFFYLPYRKFTLHEIKELEIKANFAEKEIEAKERISFQNEGN